ncbi:PEP-CTERM sorting domain-containing protein [Chamaesiphon sp. VAR_48_metabat_135_sub]|uniref:PEP-CTERM sorting domain-containing protein n=1 Tax=Chamaesiphon sp. VAR_48_metabat_135_sub TaxID=2964699 RepID=UPI002869F5EC|nr:PEP-CTERM sorting domain-containing protein [Chamaesiphon sp. VAR_48_metabat_135_sub]
MKNNIVKSSIITATIALMASIIGTGIVGINSALAVTLGTNTIVNGDAESPVDPVTGQIAGWTTNSDFRVVGYGTTSTVPGTIFPQTTDPGPVNRGNNFFYGGPEWRNTAVSQQIDVSTLSSIIDAGHAQSDLSAFFGGSPGQLDIAYLRVIFNSEVIGGTAQTLGGYELGDSSVTMPGLFEKNNVGLVPIGTRSISVNLFSRGFPGYSGFASGYFDNISLVLTDTTAPAASVPEPAAVPGLLIGGAVVFYAIKKRQAKL